VQTRHSARRADEGGVSVVVSLLNEVWSVGWADDGNVEGSDWRGIHVRRAISSARPRTRRCATGKDLVLFSLVALADGLSFQGCQRLLKSEFIYRASQRI
jgi:hypothetical protein